MAVRQRLEIKQTQGLRLTPQLAQSLKLLQMTNVELSAFLAAELERNPLLQEAPADRQAPEDLAAAEAEERQTTEDVDLDQRVYEASDAPAPSTGPANSDPTRALEQSVAARASLRDHLRDQIFCDLGDPRDRALALALLEELEPTGYYVGDLASAAQRMGVDEKEAAAMLARLQALDPAGVFARDLKECLALQLADRDRLDPAMQALLDNLEMLGRGDLERLRRRCRVDEEDFAEMLAELRRLDPKPGLAFEADAPDSLAPDVLVTRLADGGWRVEINPETLPRVLVDRAYHSELKAGAGRGEAKSYLAEQLANASWLVRALDQRQRTLSRVATALVERQQAFFEEGVAALQPLTMRELAEILELHESTVSRAVADKLMLTPLGGFPMKAFFSAGVTGAAGEGHAGAAVKHRIKALIEAEDPDKPLSDDALVGRLAEEGVEVARRTVAKYRDALGIGSSAQRRRRYRARARMESKKQKSRYSGRNLPAI